MEKKDRIHFYTKDGGIEYNRKEEAFRLINRKFPILKENGCIISEKSTKPVCLGFVTEVKRISGLPPLAFDFFKNHIDDSCFNGETVIYFNEKGSFSNEPSPYFISFLGNKKIKGDMVSIYNAMVNFPGEKEKIDLEKMKIEYMIFLLKKEPAESFMFAFTEEKANINYAYGEVSISPHNKLIAEVFNDGNDAVYKEEMDFCYLSYLFLSPNRIIGDQLVRKLEKILIENS